MADFGSDFKLKVTTQELRNKADTVRNLVNSMDRQFNNFDRIIRNTAVYWIGDGGDTSRQKYQNQKTMIETMIKRLREYPDDLLKIAGVYETAEKGNVEEAQPLASNVIV